VICPGFSADCLETLEEIEVENRDTFLEAGGREYHYIPALNTRPDHIEALAGLVERHVTDWG
jgi:ferrochelatase